MKAKDRGLRGPNLNDISILYFWPLDLQEMTLGFYHWDSITAALSPSA